MLSSLEEYIHPIPEVEFGWIEENLVIAGSTSPVHKYKGIDGKMYYSIGKDNLTWYQQPRGYYCRVCFKLNWETVEDWRILSHKDGDAPLFWSLRCNTCIITSSRKYAAQRWTEAIKVIDPSFENIRFVTLTIPSIEYPIHEILGNDWRLFDNDENFMKWVYENCRQTPFNWKYLGNKNAAINRQDKLICKKLKLRLKNMRHKNKRFMSKVKGGLNCYESPISINIEKRTLVLNCHLHAIFHGDYYDSEELEEDWGLGFVRINKIKEDPWSIQLEVAKYVGKNGSRRTAWGTLRKARSEIIRSSRLSTG